MPREFSRIERVSQSIRREIGPMIDETARGAKLGMVSVTEVDVSPDLRRSNVFVSVFGDQVDTAAVLEQLQDNAAAYRYALGQQLRMKNIPALQFRLDGSIEQGARLSRLLRDDDPKGTN